MNPRIDGEHLILAGCLRRLWLGVGGVVRVAASAG